ncbi:MAG: hypothetical protein H6672_18880 [Anaerolineaceae bacterium]|nr:hypothetical protein [Anaerolineaceae bacterium]
MTTIQLRTYQTLGLITLAALLGLVIGQPGTPYYTNLFPIFLIVLIWGVIVTPVAYLRERIRTHPQTKSKRGVQPDMYAMIDRMLAYLDTDEMVYLQRRLAEMEAEQIDDFPATLESLLSQREADARHKLSGR